MNVPGGYRVQVERMYGDVIAWIHATPPVLPLAGSHAGVLFSVQRTAPDSGGLTNAESNCFIYHQGAVPVEGSLYQPLRQPHRWWWLAKSRQHMSSWPCSSTI